MLRREFTRRGLGDDCSLRSRAARPAEGHQPLQPSSEHTMHCSNLDSFTRRPCDLLTEGGVLLVHGPGTVTLDDRPSWITAPPLPHPSRHSPERFLKCESVNNSDLLSDFIVTHW